MKWSTKIAPLIASALFIGGCATVSTTDRQMYRPKDSNASWMVQGEAKDFYDVTIYINGTAAIKGDMRKPVLLGTYKKVPVRALCVVGPIQMFSAASRSCDIYINGEYASHLVFKKR